MAAPKCVRDMPILSRGVHASPREGLSAMEAAAFLAGEPHSRYPKCVHPMIAIVADKANDEMPDDQRGQLWPLIIRSIGTADTRESELDRQILNVRLAAWCADRIAHLAPDMAKQIEPAIEAANAWAKYPSLERKYAAKAAHDAVKVISNSYDFFVHGVGAAYVAAQAAYAAYAEDAAAEDAAAEAAYFAAAVVTTRVAFTPFEADVAAFEGTPDDYGFLLGLIDYHAELTGHTSVNITKDRWQQLVALTKETAPMTTPDTPVAQITYSDFIGLIRWAEAAEKPWRWWDKISVLREKRWRNER